MADRDHYLLGMAPEEIARLTQQHEAWREVTERLWDLAAIAPGMTVVDLGSGPGLTTFDLARRVGEHGRVVAVDNSETALAGLRAGAAARGLANIETVVCDVQAVEIGPWKPDAVTARWLFWVLADPAALVERVASGLAPGATIAVMDYANYHAIGSEPQAPVFDRLFRAVYQSTADAGGSLDIAGRLPAMMTAAGLRVDRVEPLQQIGRPGTPVWQWVTNFQRLYFPTLVEKGYITAAELETFHSWWAAISRDPGSLFFAPPMLGVVARQ
jgi:ubiquinone/menaquinone biosynthesis C-methylase UbiE